jgi:hypothetical protein
MQNTRRTKRHEKVTVLELREPKHCDNVVTSSIFMFLLWELRGSAFMAADPSVSITTDQSAPCLAIVRFQKPSGSCRNQSFDFAAAACAEAYL